MHLNQFSQPGCLEQIATIRPGYPFRGKLPETPGSQVVAVQMKDVSPFRGVYWPGCTPTMLTGKRQPDWLQPADILVAARGGHNYAVLVGEALSGSGVQAVAAPHFFVVRIRQQSILPQYLAWLLNQGPCQHYFQQNAEGSVTKSIRRKVLEATPVAVPPMAKQKAIVGLASTLWQEQCVLEQLVSQNERLMNTIAHDLLAGDLPPSTADNQTIT